MIGQSMPWINTGGSAQRWSRPAGSLPPIGVGSTRRTWLEREMLRRLRRRRRVGWRLGVLLLLLGACAMALQVPQVQAPAPPAPVASGHAGAGITEPPIPFRAPESPHSIFASF